MGTKGKKKSSSSKSKLEEVERVKDDFGLEMEVLADDTTILEEEPDPVASSSSSSPRKLKKSKSASKARLVEKEVVKESLTLEMESIESIREADLLEEELSPTKSKARSSKRSPRGQLKKDGGSSRDSSSSVKRSGSLGVSQSVKSKKSPRSPRSSRSDKQKDKDREKEREEKEREKEKEKEREKEREEKERERERKSVEKSSKDKDRIRESKDSNDSKDERKNRGLEKKESRDKDDRMRSKTRGKDTKDPRKSPKPKRSEERGVVSAPVIVDMMASEPLSVRESMEHMKVLKNKVADVRNQLQTERDRTLGLYGDYKDLSWKELVAMHIRLRIRIQRLDQELKDLRHSKTSKTHG